MRTLSVGSIDPATAAGELNTAEIPRTVAETGPKSLGFAQSNRPVAADPQTEPSVPNIHFGNTPLAPTLSPDSARRSRGSKASPPADNSSKDNPLAKMLLVTGVGACLPPTFAAAGAGIEPTQAQTFLLEPTPVIDAAIDASINPGSVQASPAAAVPATVPPTQLLQATQVQPQITELEKSQKQQPPPQNQIGIIPETDEDNYLSNDYRIIQGTEKKPEMQQQKDSQAPPAATAAGGAAELPAEVTKEDYTLEIAELEDQLRQRWLGGHSASEEPLTTLQYTATNAASQVVASAQGSFAEALQLVEEWNSKIAEGDDLCNLRIKMLAVLQEETAEFLFGPADARKLSEVACSNWVWSFADSYRTSEKINNAVLLEKLTFSLEDDVDNGNKTDTVEDQLGGMNEEEAKEYSAFVCTKEEVAKRQTVVTAAEVKDEEYFLRAEKAPPKGVEFTEEELIAKLKSLLEQKRAAAAAAAAAKAAEVTDQQREQQRLGTETEAGTAPAAAVVIENDGPDALDINATHPSKQVADDNVAEKEKAETHDSVAKKGSEHADDNALAAAPPAFATAEAAEGDGPQELQVDLTAPQGEHATGWMAGGWSKALPGGSLPNTNPPASGDQNTPSRMFKEKDAPGGGGDGGGTAGGGGVHAGLLPGSIVPETQSEQLRPHQQRETEGFDSIVRPAAPGARFNIPPVIAAAMAIAATCPESCDGSQPEGSQEFQNALGNVGAIVDTLDGAASQQEPEFVASALKLVSKEATAATADAGIVGGNAGADGFTVPAPRQSSRLGSAGGVYKVPDDAKKPATEKQQQPQQQPQQQQQRRVSGGTRLVAKVVKRRTAHLDKVVAKGPRPDLGFDRAFLVNKPAPIAAARKQSERQQQVQKRTPADEGVPARRTSGRHILLSGLHDTADCYEMDGTDSTAAAAVNAQEANVQQPVGDGHSDPFNFPADIAAPSEKSPAPLKATTRKSPRKSPHRRMTAAPAPVATTADAAPPMRQPYQPEPIVQMRAGVLLTRLPHPVIQTAPDECSMEVSVAAGVPEVEARPRRVPPKKRRLDMEEEELTAPVATTTTTTTTTTAMPRSKRQKTSKDNNDNNTVGEDAGRRSLRWQAATTPQRIKPADSEDQTIKERWLSTGKRKKTADKTTPIDKATVKEAAVSSPRPQRAAKKEAEKKLQKSSGKKTGPSERLPGALYGCSRCRFSATGCSTCNETKRAAREAKDRAKAEAETKQKAIEAQPAAQRLAKKTAAAVAAAATSRPRLAALAPPAAKPKQKVSTLPSPVTKAATTTAADPLDGMCFLISGSGDGGEAKGVIEELITSLGGRVLADLPSPPSGTSASVAAGQSTINRRLSVDLRSPSLLPHRVDAVIADRNARRAKCIYAAIKGLPVISPDWLKACKRSKKLVAWTGKYQLLPAENPPPAPVFAGLRVHLKVSGKKSLGLSITHLMQHAGAQMTGTPKESTRDYEATCDLVIIDDDVSSDARVTLERLARRLRIPCHTRDWAIRAMLEGKLPDDFAAPNSKHKSTAAGRKRRASSPGPIPQRDAAEDEERPEEAAMDTVQPDPSSHSMELVQDQAEEMVAPSAAPAAGAGPSSTTAARRRSRRNTGDAAEFCELPLSPSKRRKPSPQISPAQPAPPNQTRRAPAAAAVAATATAASPEPGSFSWIGEPVAPLQGCTPAGRRYYDAVTFNNARIQVGSHVELSSMPGESAPRVAQVAALWAERDVNGQDKPFGRFIRLLRPDDTSLALVFLFSQKTQVFMSSVEEPRLSLKCIERRCMVAFPSCADELDGNEEADYVCMAQYDLQDGVLKPLPQH